MLNEQPVTQVDKVVDRRSSRKLAEAFVKFLFMPMALKIFVDNSCIRLHLKTRSMLEVGCGILSCSGSVTLAAGVRTVRFSLAKRYPLESDLRPEPLSSNLLAAGGPSLRDLCCLQARPLGLWAEKIEPLHSQEFISLLDDGNEYRALLCPRVVAKKCV